MSFRIEEIVLRIQKYSDMRMFLIYFDYASSMYMMCCQGGGGKDRPASKASASPKKEEGRSKVMSASNQPTDSQVEG